MKNKQMISKVKREIKILKFINHPNIIKLYEVLDTTNDIFVILELASKGELYNYIQANQITQEQAKFLFRQIIDGVQHIHLNLISHRDLKPQNILVDANNVIKIGDFGLSNLMKDGKMMKTACGSPNYAAPQIIGLRKYEGTSVDVWSCGVILFALLTSRLPFDQQTVNILYKKIQKGAYQIPKDLSPTARNLIQRMLIVDPTKRIKIYEIKSHPWLRNQIPLYRKIANSFSEEKQAEIVIDTEILEKVKKMTFNKNVQLTESKLLKTLKRDQQESFVIAYELLKDQKNCKQQMQAKEHQQLAIFQRITNIIQPLERVPQEYQYGHIFKNISSKKMAQKLLYVLQALNINTKIKSNNPKYQGEEYCIKCMHVPQKYKSQIKLPKDEEHPNQEPLKKQRFSTKIIKFSLQIYKINSSGTKIHVIDSQLTQGHPYVFFQTINMIFNEMKKYHE